jgi:3'-phosphoadenosine 5'-phosphosulfate sulfotransferase (PAPS reductase)/FAD synthetase
MGRGSVQVKIERVVCWFSCGATSAVATKLTIERYAEDYPVVVAYCDTGSEHPDNKRFLKDCENWFGCSITILNHEKYATIYDVFDDVHYLAGVYGARCSMELKKGVRRRFENLATDLQIFGFDLGEVRRAERFQANNPEVTVEFPLIDAGLSKSDCVVILQQAKIDLPVMYKMGYSNNNCIGCVKGGAGYWNKIRRDFPETFEKTAQYEEKYGAKLVMSKRKHITLRELDPQAGNYKSELPIQCGFFCGEL